MSKEIFSKGPWKWYKNISGDKIGISDAEGNDVLYVNHSESVVIPREKDAHLIAAAPDLYEALKQAVSHIKSIIEGEEWGAIEEVLDDCSAALAKARGKS